LKKPRWLLNLVILFINILRLVISCLLFYQFFHFQMPDVTALYLFYMVLDSVESSIIYFRRDLWGPFKSFALYFNSTIFVFAVVSGLMLYMPLYYIFSDLGVIDPENVHPESIAKMWLYTSFSVLIIVIVFNYAIKSSWGNIQCFLTELPFLSYCFLHISAAAIFLSLVTVATLFIAEAKKANWKISELRKKDYRFRKQEDPRFR